MSIWYCLPSARPPEEAAHVLWKWKERGYKIALFVDSLTPGISPNPHIVSGVADFVSDNCEYPGYAIAQNRLVASIMREDPQAEWFVCGGDDTEPDPNHDAEQIAFGCGRHFGELQQQYRMEHLVASIPLPPQPSARMPWSSFGVMQPTGDRWGIDPKSHEFVSSTLGCNECACRQCGRGKIAPIHLTGAYIDRVAGSPWIGREFARRMYHGTGPYFPGYEHMYVDEELQLVAQKLGVFWQRPDLIHRHNHWGRGGNDTEILSDPKIPVHLEKWNSAEHWRSSKALFTSRRAAGFPGHEPVA